MSSFAIPTTHPAAGYFNNRARYVGRRDRNLISNPGIDGAYLTVSAPGDRLAERENHHWPVRNMQWLKEHIRRGLGFKALGVKR